MDLHVGRRSPLKGSFSVWMWQPLWLAVEASSSNVVGISRHQWISLLVYEVTHVFVRSLSLLNLRLAKVLNSSIRTHAMITVAEYECREYPMIHKQNRA